MTMRIVLYYAPMSSATRVYWALEELGLPFEKIKLDLSKGEQQRPEFLKLNPNGKVPTLVVDGQPMFESLAMLIWLGETFGVEKGLFPQAGPARIDALKWLTWGQVTLGEAVFRFLSNTSERWPAELRNAKVAEKARQEIEALLRILDGGLQERDHLCGAGFSLTDCGIASLVGFIARQGFDLSKHANVLAWLGRCTSRPALARAMAG
jgi:glutathione S-transferase